MDDNVNTADQLLAVDAEDNSIVFLNDALSFSAILNLEQFEDFAKHILLMEPQEEMLSDQDKDATITLHVGIGVDEDGTVYPKFIVEATHNVTLVNQYLRSRLVDSILVTLLVSSEHMRYVKEYGLEAFKIRFGA